MSPTMGVRETLVGDPAEKITVRVPGGKAGNLDQRVHGVARLTEGDHVVLFLWKDDGGHLQVLGQAQGAFHVRWDPGTGELRCRNSVDGLMLLDVNGRRSRRGALRMGLDDMKTRVRAARKRLATKLREREEARVRRLEQLRQAAVRMAEQTRGKPGAPE